ncbi:PHD finger-containing protein [Cryptosporidium canis]|uniref:Sister chromatid cohesion protein n=1 Tax=Cryptosporidium canis TaxID=195482 RepID=A0ABQ8P6P8_9CRYT|nr:PHD finger-containing protein [Cryptosporidium canis]
MELPTQLKKRNTCTIMSENGEQIGTVNTSGKRRLSSGGSSDDVTAMFDILLQDVAPKLSDFSKINLRNLLVEVPKFDINILSQFCSRGEFCRNCESLLEEMLDSDLIIELGKKLSSISREKDSESNLVERLTDIIDIVWLFLYFESVVFNEVTFSKEVRVVSNIARSVLPSILSENTKNYRNEIFNASFIGCLEIIYTIIRANNIPELISTQIIVGLLSIFLLEDSSTMILLVIEIVVYLFISGSLSSDGFFGNSLSLIFNVMEELPQSNKAIKKARLCIEIDSYIHVYAYLLVRLVQGICIPNGMVSFDNIASIGDISIKQCDLARLICSQFATFFINSTVLNRTKRRDYCASGGSDIATVILTDLLKASFNPKYGICSTITHIIIVQLIKISNSSLMGECGPKTQSVNIDVYSRELCVHLLGVSLSLICKNINIKLSNIDSSGKNLKEENISHIKESCKDEDMKSDVLIECICSNSSQQDSQTLLKCESCGRNFHFDCVRSVTYLEIYELWKCNKCIINLISDEINTSFGIGERLLHHENLELSVELISVLDYLHRKTAANVSQSFTEPVANDTLRVITDSGSSVFCSFILEMITKLKLGNRVTVDEKEKSQTKSTKSKTKILPRKHGEIGKLYSMLLTEWVSPITKVHSSLIAYSSKFPKLLEANTIRFWNSVLSKELKNIANIILHCLLSNIYNSNVVSMRRISLNSLGQVVLLKPSILVTNDTVLNAIILSLKDKTPKVRERALAIVEKYFSDLSFFEDSHYLFDGKSLRGEFDRVTKLLLEQIFRTAYDISPLVRMASIKILRTMFQQDPSKLNIGKILLKRATAVEETSAIKKLIFDSFVSIWFSESSNVNCQMAESLVELINFSESDEFLRHIGHEQVGQNCLMRGVMGILQDNQSNKNMEILITRWSSILVDMFIQSDKNINTAKSDDDVSYRGDLVNSDNPNEGDVQIKVSRDFSETKLQILKSAEVIGKAYPKSIIEMYSYIVVYLKDFRELKSEVMIHICTVLSYVLPHMGDLEANGIELDLLKIITNSKSPQLIRSSILCLCNLIEDNEADISDSNALFPLILENIRILWEYRRKVLNSEATLDPKEVDHLRRSAWLLGCIFEFSSPKMVVAIVDDKLERAKAVQTEFGISWTIESRSGEVKTSEFGDDLGFENNILDSSNVVFDLLCDLFYLLDWNLNKGVLFPTLIQFLINQKQFVKTVKFNNLIKCTIKGELFFTKDDNNSTKFLKAIDSVKFRDGNSNLCIICLQGILSLLKNYEIQALKENVISQENDLDSSKRVSMAEEATHPFYDELNQNEEALPGNNSFFSTPNTNRRTSLQSEKIDIGSSVCSSSFSNMENLSSIRTGRLGSVMHKTSSASASQPIASHLELLLNLFQETTGLQNGRFSNSQKQLVSSLILCIIEQLNKQGLVNPTSIIPHVSGLLFSSNREVSYKSYQIVSSLFEKFPNLIVNKYKEISVYGFVFCVSNFPNLLGVYSSRADSDNVSRSIFSNEIVDEKVHSRSRFEVVETILEFFTKIYSEKCRNKRVFRESIIKGCCKQLEILMSNDETGVLLGKIGAHLNYEKKILLVLYMEFISYLFLAMPFVYESEILLVLSCLGEICVACSQNLSHDSENPLQIDAERQTFCNAILATTCTAVQQILKEEYKISENQISCFNPYSSINKDKPKYYHQDSELNSGIPENSASIISLGRSAIYGSMNGLRERLHDVWVISEGVDSVGKLIEYANEVIYLYTQTTSEKISKPVKKKNTKKKPSKRTRDCDELSDSSSSQSWSPSSKSNKNRR